MSEITKIENLKTGKDLTGLEEINPYFENLSEYENLKEKALDSKIKGSRNIENYVKKNMENYNMFFKARKTRGYLIQREEESRGTALINKGDFSQHYVLAYPVSPRLITIEEGRKVKPYTDFKIKGALFLTDKEGFIESEDPIIAHLQQLAKEVLKNKKDRIGYLEVDNHYLCFRITIDLSEIIDRKLERQQ